VKVVPRYACALVVAIAGASLAQPAEDDHLLPLSQGERIRTVPGAQFAVKHGLCIQQNIAQATDIGWDRAFPGMEGLRLASVYVDDLAGRCSATHVLQEVFYVFEVPQGFSTGLHELPAQRVPFTSVITEGEEHLAFQPVEVEVLDTIVATHLATNAVSFGKLFTLLIDVTARDEDMIAFPDVLEVDPFDLYEVRRLEAGRYPGGAVRHMYELTLSFTEDIEGWQAVPPISLGDAVSEEVPVMIGPLNLPLAIPETVEEQLAVLAMLQHHAHVPLPRMIPEPNAGSASSLAFYGGAALLASIPLSALLWAVTLLMRRRAHRSEAAAVAGYAKRLEEAKSTYHGAAQADMQEAQERLSRYYHALRDLVLVKAGLSDVPEGLRSVELLMDHAEALQGFEEELVKLYAMELAYGQLISLDELLGDRSREDLLAALTRSAEGRKVGRHDPV
jgi:hypothetical protein